MVEVYEAPGGNFVVAQPNVDLEAAITAANASGLNGAAKNILTAMATWVEETRPSPVHRRRGNLFDRDTFVAPGTHLDTWRIAREALRDDIVGNAARVSENLAYQRVRLQTEDGDQNQIWSQWGTRIEINQLMRSMWLADFTDGQFVLAWLPDRMTFKMKGKRKGDGQEGDAARRKEYEILGPAEVSLLPNERIAPIGTVLFGREQLVWVATQAESVRFDAILAQRNDATATAITNARLAPGYGRSVWERIQEGRFTVADDIVERLIVERHAATDEEKQVLREYGWTNPEYLYKLDPRYVHRYTRTRLPGQAFARVPLEEIFELLDAKKNLRAKDRAELIGGANYIIVVTLGDDEHGEGPLDEELADLHASVKTLASIPVMVGDARLKVEIIQVDTSGTLDRDKHDTPDVRIFANVWGTFVPTGDGNEDQTKLGRIIAGGLDGRRKLHRYFLEKVLIEPMIAANEDLTDDVAVRMPQIMLQFDQAWIMAMLELREKNEISRDSVLDSVGLSQETEALARRIEEKIYDELFNTQQPPGAPKPDRGGDGPQPDPSPTTRRRVGRKGARRGGAAPGTNQGKPPVNLPTKRQVRSATARMLHAEAVACELRPGRADKNELIAMLEANIDEHGTDIRPDTEDLDDRDDD